MGANPKSKKPAPAKPVAGPPELELPGDVNIPNTEHAADDPAKGAHRVIDPPTCVTTDCPRYGLRMHATSSTSSLTYYACPSCGTKGLPAVRMPVPAKPQSVNFDARAEQR